MGMLMDVRFGRNRIDHAADRIAAVEESSRSLQDFDTFQRRSIHGLGVVTRLKAQSTGRSAILQHKNTVAVEPSNDRSRGSWARAPLGHAGLSVESLTERRRRFLCQRQ